VTEQLEYIPASLFVWRHVQGKYVCKACEGHVVPAAKPRQPIEKSLAGSGLLAHVIVSKYADHQPLNRQTKILKRNGVNIARSTQCGWCADGATLLPVIYQRMGELIRASHFIQTDDTPNPVLAPGSGRGRTKTGRFWVYRGDRHHPYTVFDYTPDRSRDGPTQWLKHYTGYLQADAYCGYDQLFTHGTEAGRLIEVACWMHARRYFYDARESAPGLPHTAMA
jgi:transposase